MDIDNPVRKCRHDGVRHLAHIARQHNHLDLLFLEAFDHGFGKCIKRGELFFHQMRCVNPILVGEFHCSAL